MAAETFSLRDVLGARGGRPYEVIQIREVLARHPKKQIAGLAPNGLLNFIQTHCRLNGNTLIPQSQGEACGCKTGVRKAYPAWVGVGETTYDSVRTIEGVLPRKRADGSFADSSKVAYTDYHPVHMSHDWNIFLKPDKQYRHMLMSDSFERWGTDVIENEWETRDFELSPRPFAGDRVVLFGKHIIDCAHPEPAYHSEIHPPFGIVSMRPSGVRPNHPWHGHEQPRWQHSGGSYSAKHDATWDGTSRGDYFVPCTYGHVYFNRKAGKAWAPPGLVETVLPKSLERGVQGGKIFGAAGAVAGIVAGLFESTCEDYAGGSSTMIPREVATARDYAFDVYPPTRRPEYATLAIGFVGASAFIPGSIVVRPLPSSDSPLFFRIVVKGSWFENRDSLAFRFFCYWDPYKRPTVSHVRRYRVHLDKVRVKDNSDATDGEFQIWVGVTGSWVNLNDVAPGLGDTDAYTDHRLGIDMIATVMDDQPLRICGNGFEKDLCWDDEIGTADVDWTPAQLDRVTAWTKRELDAPLWKLTYYIQPWPPPGITLRP